MTLKIRVRVWHFALALTVLVLDRCSKSWIVARVAEDVGSITVIPKYFSITHVENPGAAFGFFANSSSPWAIAALTLFSSAALLAVGFLLWKSSERWTLMSTALALILGGAAGNLWDRLLRHHVTDFLHCYIGTHIWPDFNFADSAIVCGAILLIADLLLPQRKEQ